MSKGFIDPRRYDGPETREHRRFGPFAQTGEVSERNQSREGPSKEPKGV